MFLGFWWSLTMNITNDRITTDDFINSFTGGIHTQLEWKGFLKDCKKEPAIFLISPGFVCGYWIEIPADYVDYVKNYGQYECPTWSSEKCNYNYIGLFLKESISSEILLNLLRIKLSIDVPQTPYNISEIPTQQM